MIRSGIATRIVWILTVAAAAAFTLLAGAPDAAADSPLERPCQPKVEAAVRAALPTATTVYCPLSKAEYRIVNGQSVPQPHDVVKAEAALGDGRLATVEVKPPPEPEAKGALATDAPARDTPPVDTEAHVLGISYAHSDVSGSSGPGMALLFWLVALASVVGAIFVISRRNLIAAVMGMVGSFVGIAAIYMMLYAQFLAVVQMLVYAGAIMVLFVFVVMILNRPEDQPVAPSGRAGQVLGGLGIVYLVGRLIMMLSHVVPANPEVAMNAPAPLPEQCVEWRRDDSVQRNPGEPVVQTCVHTARPEWGSVTAVGIDLFGAGLFPFEAISILLLAAVVGAIAIARPLGLDDSDGEDTDDAGPGGTGAHPEGGHA